MIVQNEDGVPRYVFEAWRDSPIVHGVFTRRGGVSEGAFSGLNVGNHVGDAPGAVEANHQAIYNSLGVNAEQMVMARQVHGAQVARVGTGQGGTTLDETDALVTDDPRVMLLLRFADCVPVLLYAPEQHAVGLVHAGWQGTLASIAAVAVASMCREFGCRPDAIEAGIGPSIGPCCFEIGPEVVERVRDAFAYADDLLTEQDAQGKAHLDLWHANQRQLEDAGVRRFEVASLCTACHLDEFFSHRAEQGRTGRFAVVIGLRDK